MLRELNLFNFRNFQSASISFSGSDVVLVGRNGSGKTNVLEAVNHLSILRSFRGASVREEVRIGESSFVISCKLYNGISERSIAVREYIAGRRELMIDSVRISRSSEFIGEFGCVPFVPEDKEIISGSSGFRRRFFDMLISTVDSRYFSSLMRYHRALEQRNAALRTGNIGAAEAFETELADQFGTICAARADMSSMVSDEMSRLMSGRYVFSIEYRPSHSGDRKSYLERFVELRDREIMKRHTLFGPQLDEFDFILNGRPLRGFCSNGQQRISALMLRLAQFNMVKNHTSIPIIALVDDVTGELDEDNLACFQQCISNASQRIYTFAEMPKNPSYSPAQVIDVSFIAG
ncbi:MAG: DNA replication and repair protein RecF [Victivallaceae bacterium]|nr:DNA replication and repair protein RecF [Victivallaceae bacterium]